jgi:hypothetical protein
VLRRSDAAFPENPPVAHGVGLRTDSGGAVPDFHRLPEHQTRRLYVRVRRASRVRYCRRLFRGRAARPSARHTRAITGKALRFEMCPGLLEIRFYAAHHRPAYAYGPGFLRVSHGPKEFVHSDRMVDCAAIYARVDRRVGIGQALRPIRQHVPSRESRSEIDTNRGFQQPARLTAD